MCSPVGLIKYDNRVLYMYVMSFILARNDPQNLIICVLWSGQQNMIIMFCVYMSRFCLINGIWYLFSWMSVVCNLSYLYVIFSVYHDLCLVSEIWCLFNQIFVICCMSCFHVILFACHDYMHYYSTLLHIFCNMFFCCPVLVSSTE